MADLFRNDDALLTASQIKESVREYNAWGDEIDRLEGKRAQRKEWLAVVAKIIGPQAAAGLMGGLDLKVDEPTSTVTRRTRHGGITWTAFVEDYLRSVNRRVDYGELREAVSKSVLGPKLEEGDKSFYGAILKLCDRGAIIKKAGYLFSPEAFADHEKRVKDGLENELVEVTGRRPAPLEDEVKRFLDACKDGATGKDVVEHIQTVPEFAEAASRNSTGVYNVLSRMVKRDRIRKIAQRYYSPDAPSAASQ